MGRLARSTKEQLRQVFENWSETPLLDFGFAITTKIQMLGLCVNRLNGRVDALRKILGNDEDELRACLEKGHALTLRDNHLAYELLLDMDSFIFESRSLYEIVGKFLRNLLEAVSQRKITEKQLKAMLSTKGIDTRWIDILRETRQLFFHQTAPWLAIQVDSSPKRYNPILLKKSVVKIDTSEFVSFESLREIYEGFVNSLTALHDFVMEEIRKLESQS
jgi:hypothetical protein